VIAAVFLLVSKPFLEKYFNLNKRWIFVYVYIILAILSGMFISLNSLKELPNIQTYSTIVLFLAVFVPIDFYIWLIIISISHLLFITAIIYYSDSTTFLKVLQINSTVSIIVAIVLQYTFYMYRKREFLSDIKLKNKEKTLRKIFELNPFPVVITRISDGYVLQMNKKAYDFYGISEKGLETPRGIDFYIDKHTRENITQELESKGKIDNLIIDHHMEDGSRTWVLINSELIEYQGEDSILTGIVDITGLKKIEKELMNSASSDELTGIMNRRKGIHELEKKISFAEDNKENFMICFLDLDNLKVINDTYGHSEGDKYINTIVKIINENITIDDLFFRYGGDEFIIAFINKNMDSIKEIITVVEDKFIKEEIIKGLQYNLSASFGFSDQTWNSRKSLDEMIKEADEHMYINKKEKKKNMKKR
jgi:diguanylate cyclase (GGDEF)-like protein/PAS domain S-box-containing protein